MDEKLVSEMPLVGPVAGKLENNGILVRSPGAVRNNGGAGGVMLMGLGVPLPPPTAEGLLPQPNPICVPISRANVLVAATTRASISTSGVLRSSLVNRSSILGSVAGISSMITALLRSSETTSPRAERNFLTIGITSREWA